MDNTPFPSLHAKERSREGSFEEPEVIWIRL